MFKHPINMHQNNLHYSKMSWGGLDFFSQEDCSTDQQATAALLVYTSLYVNTTQYYRVSRFPS